MNVDRRPRPARAGVPLGIVALAVTVVLATPEPVPAQAPGAGFPIRPLEATPVGALPPMALPMPASRDHNLWGLHLQAGQGRGGAGENVAAVGGGIDFQWMGGSVFGVTGGWQTGACRPSEAGCRGHALFGARARLNLITGGPTIATLFGDESATTTLGTELGLGYGPNVAPELNACTVDLGAPVSVAMLQRARLVSFVTPAVGLELDCSAGEHPARLSLLTSLGVGVQQLGLRGLDVYLALQKIFRRGTGYSLGLSIAFVRLP